MTSPTTCWISRAIFFWTCWTDCSGASQNAAPKQSRCGGITYHANLLCFYYGFHIHILNSFFFYLEAYSFFNFIIKAYFTLSWWIMIKSVDPIFIIIILYMRAKILFSFLDNIFWKFSPIEILGIFESDT